MSEPYLEIRDTVLAFYGAAARMDPPPFPWLTLEILTRRTSRSFDAQAISEPEQTVRRDHGWAKWHGPQLAGRLLPDVRR